MRHIFCKLTNDREPQVGDLIRSEDTMDFINIVLQTERATTELIPVAPVLWVRSVRYGNTNGGNFRLLGGKRSRLFKWSPKWHVVEEYTRTDNVHLRMHLVKELEGVDTSYHPPTGGDQDDDTDE